MYKKIGIGIVIIFVIAGTINPTRARTLQKIRRSSVTGDSLKVPIEDREGDFITDPNKNPWNLNDPNAIEKKVEYDPTTQTFKITESIGGRFIKNPTYLTLQEYMEYEKKNSIENYFAERSLGIDLAERKSKQPQLYKGPDLFRRRLSISDTTGGGFKIGAGVPIIQITPSGTVELTLGVNSQKIDNPVLLQNQRKQTNFDFDMNIQLNVTGQIGDLVKLGTNFNTKATFDFENQIKLGFKGKEDDIIQEISAGNVSLPLKSSLIRGNQSLFGLKTQLKFGRLTATNILSQQKSQTQNIRIEGGAQVKKFEIKSDEYEENKHFYIAQYFRDNYEANLSKLPVITSQVVINRMEVWITNKTRQTEDVREIVALADLGEKSKMTNFGLANYFDAAAPDLPTNNANRLYRSLLQDETKLRDPSTATNYLENILGLTPVTGFERTSARKLQPTEYIYNKQLGYLSLNQTLRPDEVLGVAIEYTINGKVYQLGEFSGDLPPNIDTNNIKDRLLVLKLLKATSIRTSEPIWNLMMKNVYSLNSYQINPQDFFLEIFYKDPGGGDKRYLPDGGDIAGKQLLKVLRLDQLNNQNDPQPDGRFDFINDITINTRNGRIYFPVVEPFGDHLRKSINNNSVAGKYVYDLLYDSTRIFAQQFPEFNRYIIRGSYKASVTNEISLNTFNIPQGSVIVTAGGQQLRENIDYTVEYGLGRIKILNEGIINSGVPIDVKFENNVLFGIQNKSLIGTRLDYTINKNFGLGFTHMRLAEKPFTQKVNIGDDPIRNNIIGFDINYATSSQGITKFFNKITAQDTKTPSAVSFSGEAAHFNPGTAKGINLDNQATVYVDDFEGTSINYDLKFPFVAWNLSSTPKGMPDFLGIEKFPESRLSDSVVYGFNRAKLSWYQIDNLFYSSSNANPLKDNRAAREDKYVRQFTEKQVFPNRDNANIPDANLFTFDISYDPFERGQYNYETNAVPGISAGVDDKGKLKDPASRWGGVMRYLETNDFESANIEFIQFWVMDPFLKPDTKEKGNLYIHLGSVSEDILKDSRKQYENGLPRPTNPSKLDTSAWGVTPRISNSITNAFDADPDVIKTQDVGLDGFDNEKERTFYAPYLNNLQGIVDADAFASANNDPSNDDYVYSLDANFSSTDNILTRYRNFNGTQGNSSQNASSNNNLSGNSKNTPDNEDLNNDNSLNETEEYYQYRVDLSPQGLASSPFVTDRVSVPISVDGRTDSAVWYQIQIPILQYEARVGNIPDFRSIRYIRMVLSDFEEPVTLRFAQLNLVRNQWRRYLLSLGEPRETLPDDGSGNNLFNVNSVSVENNAGRKPIPYAIPPGISREQSINGYFNAFQNEQALSMQVCELQDGDAKAAYKLTNLDLRNFKTLKMFAHAESLTSDDGIQNPIKDNDVNLFFRIGTDLTENYYEYELPLKVTPSASYNPESDADRRAIWPEENEMNLPIDSLTFVKQLRNNADFANNQVYIYESSNGRKIRVKGNPDLGQSTVIMAGIRNPQRIIGVNDQTDDGLSKCAEVWINELRLAGLDNDGGWAALARMDMQLGDLGNMTVSATMHTIGFGDLEQKVNQRYMDNYIQYDVAANVNLGKLLPEKAGLQIPVYANLSQSISTPEYDPYELDIQLKNKIDAVDVDPNLNPEEKKDLKKEIKDEAQTVTTIKSINVTNLRKVKTNPQQKTHIYDIENFNFTYAFTQTERQNPTIENEVINKHKGAMGYNYSSRADFWQPFKNVKNNSKYLKPFKEIGINYRPTTLGFRTEINRQFGETKVRDIGNDGLVIDPTFDKYFTWNRAYNYKHDLTKTLSFDFNASNAARIDEPFGRIDTKEKRDSLKQSFWSFGRNVNYTHNFNAGYVLPFKNVPYLDWISGNVRYGSSYTWTAPSLQVKEWGNIISNSNNIQMTGELNFKNFYNAIPFLRPYNSPTKHTKAEYEESVQKKKEQQTNISNKIQMKMEEIEKKEFEIEQAKEDTSKTKEDIKQLITQKKMMKNDVRKFKEDRSKVNAYANPTVDIFMQPLMMLKRVSINYDVKRSTTLPGFMPNQNMFGQSFESRAPGFGFLFGAQKDTTWLGEIANKGWLTTDTTFNYQFQQTKTKTFSLKIGLEPFRDLRVDINLNKQSTQNYSEFYKKIGFESTYQHLTPAENGSFSVSFLMFRTVFDKIDENNFSKAFRNFEELREEFSQTLGNNNPNSAGQIFENDTLKLNNFTKGYGPYSQDVLVPAFIAAYTGKDVGKVKLNPLKTLPLPNWRLTYSGFSKMKWGQKLFQSFTITHGYQSTFTVSSFSTDLNFAGTPGFGGDDVFFVPSAIDSLSGNYYNLYNIPQISVTEQLAPLIGIDITWKNSLITDFEFKKSRTLGLSFLDFQLSETRSTEITAGLGYTLAKFKLPFKIGGKKLELENDVNLRADFSLRNDRTVNYKLDQNVAEPTRGNKTISFSPTIDYVVNQKLNVRIFYDFRKQIPATLASYPITSHRGGLTFRFSLAP
ncbi:MAG: cell surface protein SprA [Chitinophagales bacterium]|nr:cell surface protein SprA [Chitinophagales bacterium]